jgi:hypothetical protein
MILPAGTNAVVTIVANAQNGSTNASLGNGSTIQIKLEPGQSNAQGQSSYQSVSVPGDEQVGNILNVTTASLSAAKATGYGDQAAVSGTQNMKVGSFTLSSGSTENLDINSIGIDIAGSATSSLQNLRLVNDSTNAQIGTTISSPSTTGTNTFSTSNVVLSMSSSMTVDVYANIPVGAANTATYILSIDHLATNATGATTGTSATIGGSNIQLQTITVGSGSLGVALGASNPVSSNVVAGASSVKAADYTFSANTSSYTVKNLEITMPLAAAKAVNSITLSYTDASGATKTATQGLVTTSTGPVATSTFSGLTFYVPANGSADLAVNVSTPIITTGATTISGNEIITTLVGQDVGTPSNVQIQDASGNVTDSINSGVSIPSNTNGGYGVLVLHKSVPTFSGQSLALASAPNTGTTLYQFTIAADPAGPVDIDQLSFKVSASSGVTMSGFQLYNSLVSTPLNSSGVSISSGIVTIIPDQIIQVPASGTTTFILKATTVTGFGSGSSYSISLAPATGGDATWTATAAAGTSGAKTALNNNNAYVWSDRSANNDLVGSTQWTNGYLLRDLLDGTYSYSSNF